MTRYGIVAATVAIVVLMMPHVVEAQVRPVRPSPARPTAPGARNDSLRARRDTIPRR